MLGFKTYPVKTPHWVQKLFPSVLWRKEQESPAVYLTFDDGPTPGVTDWVLDTLALYNAKATFFCIGKNVVAHPELYQRILEEGHSVGNHSYSHCNGWQTSTEDYLADVNKAQKWIASPFFRPPYGKLTRKQFEAINQQYQLVLWEVMPGDFDPKASPRKCLERIQKTCAPGSIVVLHDSVKCFETVQYCLAKILESKEWKFEAL